MLLCTAKFPTPPDPATTPATKQPVAQFFSAAIGGVGAVSETEYALTDTACAPFEVNVGDEVTLMLFYKDSSGLPSPVKSQTFVVPEQADTIPPDAPGDFGEVTFQEQV